MIRRTQAERSDDTTARLVRAARDLFGADGYAATSIDAVAAAAGMTKGAAYHHFAGKAELFRAAFTAELADVATRLELAAAEERDPWAALSRGTRAFLEHCLDRRFRRIVLLDAPSILGWETVREIEHSHTLRVLLTALRQATTPPTEAASSGHPPTDGRPNGQPLTEAKPDGRTLRPTTGQKPGGLPLTEQKPGGQVPTEQKPGGRLPAQGEPDARPPVEGDVDERLPARAQLLFGALCEAGMLLARSADPAADLPRLAAEADRFLTALKP
ncbi:TetR family transcriptional regulator [Nonomuraea terrae]|uniref:TetR/AcrR family transcriptional regulator n=1 Tax=Nonomuraea terrae TaxID=2530383 RepID=UPI0037B8B75B